MKSAKKLKQLKEKEKDSRRHLILDAARNLFSKKDFRSVTVREISKAADVSIGTIYNYYTNLDDLFLDVFLIHAEAIIEQLDNQFPKGAPLDELCRLYITYLNKNMTFYQMMSHFMIRSDSRCKGIEKLDHMMRKLMDRIEASIIIHNTQMDSRLMAHALFSALNGIMISYARYPGKTSDEILHHTIRLSQVIASIFKCHRLS